MSLEEVFYGSSDKLFIAAALVIIISAAGAFADRGLRRPVLFPGVAALATITGFVAPILRKAMHEGEETELYWVSHLVEETCI